MKDNNNSFGTNAVRQQGSVMIIISLILIRQINSSALKRCIKKV